MQQLIFTAGLSSLLTMLVAYDMHKTQSALIRKLASDNVIMHDTLKKIITTRDPKLIDILNENVEFWSVVQPKSQ